MKCEKRTESTDRIDHIEHLLNHTYNKLERAIKDSGEEYRDFQADIEKLTQHIQTAVNAVGCLAEKIGRLEAKIKQLEANK